MKQALLGLIFILTFTIFAQAQNALVRLDPDPVVYSGHIDPDASLDEKVAHATLTNISSDTLCIKWQVANESHPDSWVSLVCDAHSCYPPFVRSNIDPELNLDAPVVLAPDSSTILDVHVRPDGRAGTGTLDLVISNVCNGADEQLMTAAYTFEILNPTSTHNLDKQSITLFPNPAASYFELNNIGAVEHIKVYNIVGRQVKNFDAEQGEKYFIGDLPSGIYLVGLADADHRVLKTIRLNKRSMRP